MRILFLTPWYPDEKSTNSGAFIRSQAVALTREHEVIVISSKVDYSKFSVSSFTVQESTYAQVREFRVAIKKSLPLYNQVNHLLITCWLTWRIARTYKPDMIHACIGFPGAIWGWVTSKIFGCPFIYFEHTRMENNFRSFFHKRVTLFSVKRAWLRVAVSSRLASEMEVLIKRPVQVVPNIVEVVRFKNVDPSILRVPQLGFLGGMNTSVKGLDVLLKSLVGIPSEFVLHIGGTGSLENEYKALASSLGLEKKCKFYGFIPYLEVPKFMAGLHFLICSSRYETFNVALVEAMASGLPVVATKCGGPQDFVNETNGVLTEVDNEESLRDGVSWMMKHYSSFDRNAIRQFATDNFSAENVFKRMTYVYSMNTGN